MATGQTLMTLASIILLGIISMSVRSMYVQSVNNTIDSQVTSDALNFGRDIAEEIHSFAFAYDQLDAVYGQMNDVTNNEARIEFTSPAGLTLYTTIELSAEQELKHNQLGRQVTIRVFEQERENDFRQIAEYLTAVLPL